MSDDNAGRMQIEYDAKLVGLARVSTEDQEIQMQIDALQRAGVAPDRIVLEYGSGAAEKRPQRELAMKMCREGMTLVVWKIDRLGRRFLDVFDTVEKLRKRGVGFRSLTEFVDTSTPIGKASFGMLAIMAELERDNIVERTTSGIASAKARGTKFGQPVMFKVSDVERMRQLQASGKGYSAIAREMGCSPSTVKNYLKGNSVPDPD